jgi:copper transport protein
MLALAALAVAPAAASAHAMLEATVPARGAQLAHAPSEVVFRFDEPVDAGLGGVRVVDVRGREVQSGGGAFHPGGRGAEVAVRLPAELPDGGYTATYQVISADSHPVSGGFTFTVGDAGAPARSLAGLLAAQRAGPVTSAAFAAARAVQYAAIALALGALLFLAVCWWPAVAEAGIGGGAAAEAFARRLRVLLLAAGAAGLASALAGVALEGAAGQGTSLWRALRPGVIEEVLGTRFGVVWALAAAAWALLALYAAALGRAMSRREAAVLALPVAPLVLLPGLAGHASAEPPVGLLLPADVLHVVAVSAWLGGIAVLVVGLRAATARLEGAGRTRLLVAVVGRFSRLAGVAFAVLLATGVAQAVVLVASVHALADTAFGRAVLIKLVLFAALVALGWAHRSRTLPALRSAAAAAAAPGRTGVLLRRLLRAELGLGVAVLAVTGALAGYVPARDAATGPWSGSADVGRAHLEATVDPAAPGPNRVHLYLLDARSGAQYTGAKEVTATGALPERHIGALSLDTRRAGPGHYVAGGTLGAAGRWQLVVTVRVSAFDEHVARFAVPVR